MKKQMRIAVDVKGEKTGNISDVCSETFSGNPVAVCEDLVQACS